MLVRSKAPLRIGFGGGGSDVSPYSDIYGGYVLNATINMYAYCTIQETKDQKIVFEAKDLKKTKSYASKMSLELDGEFDLFKGIYNKIVNLFTKKPLSFKMTTYSDAIAGSGLGGSSTMVVAILHAFCEWLRIPLGEYEIANLAYEIERVDIGLEGGKQDQYAASFGGFNFMEFYQDRVIVNPLRVKSDIIDELEMSMLLYFSGISRQSSQIIKEQIKNTKEKNSTSLEATHTIKDNALKMKEALLVGDIKKFAKILDQSWKAKKDIASLISNQKIDQAYYAAKQAGALAGKFIGCGGASKVEEVAIIPKKIEVKDALLSLGGEVQNVNFTKDGARGWIIR